MKNRLRKMDKIRCMNKMIEGGKLFKMPVLEFKIGKIAKL
jgi:hypothetical protein